jgi:predicted ATPase
VPEPVRRGILRPMITQVVLKNFKCLRDMTLRLSPLTVLAGANGSGKSAVLESLNPTIRYGSDTVWQRDRRLEVLVSRTLTSGAACVSTFVSGNARDGFHLEGERYSFQTLRLDATALRRPDQSEDRLQLAPVGGNLASLFASLPRPVQQQLAEQLCALVPLYQDVGVRTIKGKTSMHGLCFLDRWNSELWYRPEEVSDGTLLLLAFLALGCQTELPDLLAIEAPERGLHPHLLGKLMDQLRGLTLGSSGRPPVQVVLTTYSAELLDHVQPGEVRLLHRDPRDGAVIVLEEPSRKPGWGKKIKEHQGKLGSAWLAGALG